MESRLSAPGRATPWAPTTLQLVTGGTRRAGRLPEANLSGYEEGAKGDGIPPLNPLREHARRLQISTSENATGCPASTKIVLGSPSTTAWSFV